jgi:hypothetical protein
MPSQAGTAMPIPRMRPRQPGWPHPEDARGHFPTELSRRQAPSRSSARVKLGARMQDSHSIRLLTCAYAGLTC